jgi:insertion element IS1 protein InsB
VQVIVHKVEAAAVDELWSFVGSKRQQRWLGHAMDHRTGQVLASVFGTREDETFLPLHERFAPCGITHFSTDGWGAYRRHIDPDQHTIGKQHTQKIERKHTTLRARIKRLVRKTICFSKSIQRHALVIGLFINRFA